MGAGGSGEVRGWVSGFIKGMVLEGGYEGVSEDRYEGGRVGWRWCSRGEGPRPLDPCLNTCFRVRG